ncbi:MAG: MlrC C-terminal domain-containing protein, partial [Alphaproteobacteria bacterium]|nr:MlrC C-terminal domain-containing protein [Alphaproteobacteria bacterium]
VLDALLKNGAKDAVIVIADPEAVTVAETVGVDGTFDSQVGGKVDSPGIATSNLTRLYFKKRPSPLYPLDHDGFSEIPPYDVR